MANSVEFQVQLKLVDDEGREANIDPQNNVADIWTGALENGDLQLPGSSPTERLQQTLQNIRMYLYNLSLISDVRRKVVTQFDSDSTTDIASAKSLKLLKEVDDKTIADLKKHDGTRATDAVYSHVALTDTYTSSVGAAADSVGASSKALYDAYTKANKTASDALKAHDDSRSTASKYSHVALTDAYDVENSKTQAAANSIAASGYALYRAYKYAKDSLKTHDDTRATSTVYSHVKLSDSYAASDGAAADSVGASSKALYDAYTKANKTAADNLKTHEDSRSTASKYSHVALTDEYTVENSKTQAAANSIGASGYALYRAYKYAKDSLQTHADSRANATDYSHVKLTDSFEQSVGAATDSVAPSSKALYDAYTKANKTAADNLKSHNDSRATDAVFSHVALTDEYTAENSTTQAAANSIAASGYALYRAYKYAKDSLKTHDDTRATDTVYSHVKLSDGYTASAGAAADSVGASSKALYDAYTKANKTASDNLKSHNDSRATDAVFSHVALTDDYTVENSTTQAAANSIAASGYALYKAYKYAKDSLQTHADSRANATDYSHVKLSDSYTASGGAAADSVGASSKALYDAYTKANKTAADNLKSHADSRSTNAVYSHVALTDDYSTDNSTTQAAANAVGASGYALYKAYKYAKDSLQTHSDSKATASVYSHVKLTDAFETSSGAAANSIAPSSKALFDAYTKANKTASDNLKSHADSRSTDAVFSHVALTDEYTAENSTTQAAANAVGASGYALYKAYKYAKDSLTTHQNTKATASVYSHVKLSDAYTSSGGAAADSVGASSKAVYDAYTAANTNSTNKVDTHAAVKATDTVYSHVKLSDEYTASGGAAADAVGASSKALYDAYTALNNAKAPKAHATSATTYGKGTTSAFGHLKISDTYSSSVSGANAAGAVAASQNALYNAYAALIALCNQNATDVSGKAVIAHASTEPKYGVGTEDNYGHLKISDAYDTDNSTTGAAANSVAASSWAVYRAYTAATSAASTALSTHNSSRGTASAFGHVKLSDAYTSSGGAASAAVGASSKAVYDAYTAANTNSTNKVNTHAAVKATGSVLGHVTLSDEYATDNSKTGAAANSIGASSYAVYRAYSAATSAASTALSNHAGVKGVSGTFGHVKLSDNYTSSAGAASESIGASSKAVYDAYTALNNAKAPKAHASTATTYGVGNASNYGHVKLSDAYTSSGGAAANAVGASSKALYDAYTALKKSIDTINSTLSSRVLQRTAKYATASNTTIALTLSAVTGTMAFSYTANSLVLNGTYLFLLKCTLTNVTNVERVMLEAYMNVTPSGGSAVNKALIEAACDVKPYATSFGGTIATSTNPAMGIHTFSSNHTVGSLTLFAGIGLHHGKSTATATVSAAELYIIKIPV